MKTPLVAVLAWFPLVVAAAEPAPVAPEFKFALPSLKLSEALKQAPLQQLSEKLKQTPLTLSNAPAPSVPPVTPAALLAPKTPSRNMILVPKNVDPHMPIIQPDAAIDPKILVPAPGAKSGK